jgi:hypothetical protein
MPKRRKFPSTDETDVMMCQHHIAQATVKWKLQIPINQGLHQRYSATERTDHWAMLRKRNPLSTFHARYHNEHVYPYDLYRSIYSWNRWNCRSSSNDWNRWNGVRGCISGRKEGSMHMSTVLTSTAIYLYHVRWVPYWEDSCKIHWSSNSLILVC